MQGNSNDARSKIHRWPHIFWAMLFFALIMVCLWWLIENWLFVLFILCGMFYLNVHYKEGLSKIGFRPDNISRCFSECLKYLVAVVGVLALFGAKFGTNRLPLSLLRAMFLYLLFCAIQQYILNGFFVNRLVSFYGEENNPKIPTIIAGSFALAHLPNWFLMIVTFLCGYICVRVFLKYRNLYFLIPAHFIIGSMLNLVVPHWIIRHLIVGPYYFSQ